MEFITATLATPPSSIWTLFYCDNKTTQKGRTIVHADFDRKKLEDLVVSRGGTLPVESDENYSIEAIEVE